MGSFLRADPIEESRQVFGHAVGHNPRVSPMWPQFTSDARALSREYNPPVRRRGTCYPLTSDLMLMGR